MAIVRAPKRTDSASKCSRWRVIVYNPTTHKQEWFTVEGTKREAEALERQSKEKLSKGTYVSRAKRMTVQQLADAFILTKKSRARRTSTVLCLETVLRTHLLAAERGLASRDVALLRLNDFLQLFESMLAEGISASTVNRTVAVAKALWFFAQSRQLVEHNPLQRFESYKPTVADKGRKVKRAAYGEPEVRALLDAAKGHERPFIGLLVFAGLRPGEVYALRASDLDLTGGAVWVSRSYDHCGKSFVETKTKAGIRAVPLAGWLVEELRLHVEGGKLEGEGLLFTTPTGRPFYPTYVRRFLWTKLIARAGIRVLDMYSLRHTFASLARSSGEASFNVARTMGHARSALVDGVYAHSLPSGLHGVGERVAGRVFDTKPQLRVVEGSGTLRDVRQSLEESTAKVG